MASEPVVSEAESRGLQHDVEEVEGLYLLESSAEDVVALRRLKLEGGIQVESLQLFPRSTWSRTITVRERSSLFEREVVDFGRQLVAHALQAVFAMIRLLMAVSEKGC